MTTDRVLTTSLNPVPPSLRVLCVCTVCNTVAATLATTTIVDKLTSVLRYLEAGFERYLDLNSGRKFKKSTKGKKAKKLPRHWSQLSSKNTIAALGEDVVLPAFFSSTATLQGWQDLVRRVFLGCQTHEQVGDNEVVLTALRQVISTGDECWTLVMRAGRVKQASGQPPSDMVTNHLQQSEKLDQTDRIEQRQEFLTSLNLDRLFTKRNLSYLNDTKDKTFFTVCFSVCLSLCVVSCVWKRALHLFQRSPLHPLGRSMCLRI